MTGDGKTESKATQPKDNVKEDEVRKKKTEILTVEIRRRCEDGFRKAVDGIRADLVSKEPMARGRSRFENILTNLVVGVFLVVLGWWLGK